MRCPLRCPCLLYIYCSPYFLLFLISFFFSLCFLPSFLFVPFLCFLVVAFTCAVFCASCLFPPVFLPHTRLTSIKKGLGVASILPVVFSDYGHPGTSRNTACLAETNRAKHGDNTRSVRAYVNRQPIHIPAYSSVVSLWEVPGCPVHLEYLPENLLCDMRILPYDPQWHASWIMASAPYLGVRWRPRAGKAQPEKWCLPLR